MRRVVKRISVGLAIVISSAVLALFLVVRSHWFHDYVQSRVIGAIESATGGRAEVGSFRFAWRSLTVTITDLTLHGSEPPGYPPLLQAPRIVLRLKLFSMGKAVELSYLSIERPSVNVFESADRRLNLPVSKTPSMPFPSHLERAVDLSIGQLDVTSGHLYFDGPAIPLTVHARDFLAQLRYQPAARRYEGQVRMNVSLEDDSSLNAALMLPLTVERDRIVVKQARLETRQSSVSANVSVSNLSSPVFDVEVNSRLALEDLRGLGLPVHPRHDLPGVLQVSATATASRQEIAVRNASVELGKSRFEAVGSGAAARFRGSISLDELSGLLAMADVPSGAVVFDGNARLTLPEYTVQGMVSTERLRFGTGTVMFSSPFQVTPGRIAVPDLRVSALNASITGGLTVRNLRSIEGHLALRCLQFARAASLISPELARYSGTVNGDLILRGVLRRPQAASRWDIAPGHAGIPVRGRLNVDYDTAAASVPLVDGAIHLPHSDLDIRGQPGVEAQASFHSTNLSDLSPFWAALAHRSQAALNGGVADVELTERGPLKNPALAGRIVVSGFTMQDRRFDRLSARFQASSSNISILDAALDRGVSQARFSGAIGLAGWRVQPASPISAKLDVQQGQLADFATLAVGRLAIDGGLFATASLSGTAGNPRGAVDLRAANGHINHEAFSNAAVAASLTDREVTVNTAEITAPAGRIEVQGVYHHPADNFESGSVEARVTTSEVDLSRVASLRVLHPGFGGTVRLSVNAGARLSSAGHDRNWSFTSISGELRAANIHDGHQQYGDLRVTAQTNSGITRATAASSFAGSTTEVSAAIRLAPDYPFTADLSIAHLAIQTALSLLPIQPLPLRGELSASGQLSGSIHHPQATLQARLTSGDIYGEPVSRMDTTINYRDTTFRLSSIELVTPAGSVRGGASFVHPLSVFDQGRIDLQLELPGAELSRVDAIQSMRHGLGGSLQLSLNASAELHKSGGKQELTPLSFHTNAHLRDLALQGASLGNVSCQAEAKAGKVMFNLQSDLAGSSIRGNGQISLADGYPAKAQLSFTHLSYSGFKGLLGSRGGDLLYDAHAEGSARYEGPLAEPVQGAGEMVLSRLEIRPVEGVTFRNSGPLTLTLDRGRAAIRNARITGPSTDIAVSGDLPLTSQARVEVRVRATSDLAILKTFFPGAVSAGIATMDASAGGTFANPVFSGRLQLSNGSFQRLSWPNGIYAANALIVLGGNGGRIQSFTAESGGGKVTLGGFFAFAASGWSYNFRADARQVRTRYSGASVTANAALTLSGTGRGGLLNGTVTISRVGYGQQSDIGSILSAAVKPPAPPSPGSGPFAQVRANVHIRTAPNVLFQTNLAQELDAAADLTLLGSLEDPGMVGRINITSGTLVFFANKYTVNRGLIGFYDSSRIRPVIDIDLETVAQGVDVTLTVSGPMDDLKLTYRSDPPLKFEDIVALLAAGRTPPDATIAANQPIAPDQSATQMGESALLGAAVANPIASRLQRVFGVTQLSIAPTFVSGTALPQARVTLQQQVAPNVTFTYSQDVSQNNAELLRIEWELAPRFSAVVTRDENGFLSVDFFWKKQFR